MSFSGTLLATLLVCATFYVASSKVTQYTKEIGPSDHLEQEQGAALPRDNTLLTVGALGPEDVQYFDFNQDYEADPEDFMNCTITLVTYPGYMTYIIVFEVGESQGATASIVSGGLEDYRVTVNLQSQVARGYNITIQAYGWYFEPETTTTTIGTTTVN